MYLCFLSQIPEASQDFLCFLPEALELTQVNWEIRKSDAKENLCPFGHFRRCVCPSQIKENNDTTAGFLFISDYIETVVFLIGELRSRRTLHTLSDNGCYTRYQPVVTEKRGYKSLLFAFRCRKTHKRVIMFRIKVFCPSVNIIPSPVSPSRAAS